VVYSVLLNRTFTSDSVGSAYHPLSCSNAAPSQEMAHCAEDLR
jgi:hypothetical protein